MPDFEFIRYVRWWIKHSEELSAVIPLVQQFMRGGSLERRWELMRSIGNIVVPIMEDFSEVAIQSDAIDTQDLKLLQVDVEAQGIVTWDTLTRILPVLITLIKLLREPGAD